MKALLRHCRLVTVDNQEEDTKLQSLQIRDLEILPDAYVAKNMEKRIETSQKFELLHHPTSHLGQVITVNISPRLFGVMIISVMFVLLIFTIRRREKIEDTPKADLSIS